MALKVPMFRCSNVPENKTTEDKATEDQVVE